MFSTKPTRTQVDLENLLLDSAPVACLDPTLADLLTTWLVQHGDYVATHRLVRMILDDLEKQHRPTLGLLLETAQVRRGDLRFGKALDACGSAIDAGPLFDVDRRNAFFVRLAEQNASPLSRKWGRWCEAIELKPNAIRPAHWIATNNPHLRLRALCGGNVCASIVAETIAQGGVLTYESELDVGRAFVASRGAVSAAIRKLERAGIVHRAAEKGATRLTARISI